MEQQFLNKLSDSLDKVIEKLDKQTIQIQDLTNKVDFYREAQTEQARKLDATENIAKDALSSTKAAHKRQDSFEKSIKDLEKKIADYIEGQEQKEQKDNATWLKRAIITAVLGWTGLIVAAIIKFIGG
jgi:chromosome segregation ATPase